MVGDRWDLHTDGTSRSGKKFVGQQATVGDKTLSMGFSAVSTENTTTLVDITMNLVQELSDIHNEQEAQESFLEILSNMSGTMCDRAAVMGSFAKALDKERREMLQTEENLQFLHCNAHFLLGMSEECKKATAKLEKDGGQRLGRDQLPKFRNFQSASESSVFRYVRLACDCLGPRGDEKNGCRDMWEAYCLMTDRASAITSFRGNRFNNLFEAAAALHYHRSDILDFLQSLPTLNLKLASIVEDNQSEEIDCQVIALGLLYYRVTGPYWCLLGQPLHYLQFHVYVNEMRELLSGWMLDPADAFDEEFHSLFDLQFCPKPEIWQSLINICMAKKERIKLVLQQLAAGCLAVLDRQLKEFLTGGKHFAVDDPDLEQRMQHSKLTNLIGEANFGDLDFSLFKRRNASLHHHSTINILKRNHSISQFFILKTEREQEMLLQYSARKAPALRKQHRLEERDAVAKRQVILEQHRAKKAVDAETKRLKVQALDTAVKRHDGPCRDSAAVDTMLAFYTTAKDRLAAVKAELQYRKLVLLHVSPLLKVTGPLLQLANNLKRFLGASEEEVNATEIPQLRRRCFAIDDHGSDSESDQQDASEDSEDECEDEDEGQVSDMEVDPPGEFRFSSVGQLVAVFYWDDWFVGEVVDVLSEEEGEVNFLERTKGANQPAIFRWPTRKDRCKIKSNTVFSWDIALQPCSSSGRAFVVTHPENIPGSYQAFKDSLV